MTPKTSVLDLIGNTPLLRLTLFDAGCCQLYIKLECNNPNGSIKDRTALNIINAAERNGELQPGKEIIEATAGNTGISLAAIWVVTLACDTGYRYLSKAFNHQWLERHHLTGDLAGL